VRWRNQTEKGFAKRKMSLTEISRKHFLLDIKMSSVINFYNISDCVFIIKLKKIMIHDTEK